MDNWIKILDVITWPVATLIIAFAFKNELVKILMRLTKVKVGDVEAEFDRELSIVESRTEETIKIVAEKVPSLRDSYNHSLERILTLAEVSPRASVSEAWREVEGATISLMHAYGHDPRNVQMSKVFRGIVTDNDYPWSLYEDYRRLMRLRNQAVHAQEFELSKEEAERYALAAIDLAVFIEKLSKAAPYKSSNPDAVSGAPS